MDTIFADRRVSDRFAGKLARSSYAAASGFVR
jgi:hypothetical protein